jgi:6-phosphofructokinase
MAPADDSTKTFGVMAGGGDAPGLNAAICGVGRRLMRAGHELVGFRDGWQGVLADDAVPIEWAMMQDLVTRGGCVLGAGSVSPYRDQPDGVARVHRVIAHHDLAGLIVIGGDGTLSAAARLHQEEGVAVVGVPKTIDNDLCGTDFTFGFWTAVERVSQAIDDLRTTAGAHHRVMVVECMGRHTGWITAYAGVAAAAEAILVPERRAELEDLYARLSRLRAAGTRSAVVAVAEGARVHLDGKLLSTTQRDEFGNFKTGGVAALVAGHIERELSWEARPVVLGHLQRAGAPVAFDRLFALRLGARAANLALQGRFGRMAALRNGEIVDIPLAEAVASVRKLSDHFLNRYENFFAADPRP